MPTIRYPSPAPLRHFSRFCWCMAVFRQPESFVVHAFMCVHCRGTGEVATAVKVTKVVCVHTGCTARWGGRRKRNCADGMHATVIPLQSPYMHLRCTAIRGRCQVLQFGCAPRMPLRVTSSSPQPCRRAAAAPVTADNRVPSSIRPFSLVQVCAWRMPIAKCCRLGK